MNVKKISAIFIIISSLLSFVGCNETKASQKTIDSIKDKDGIFAIMDTSKGEIVLELFYKETPLTVTNFVGLAEGTLDATNGKPFYNGLTFHRVIDNFMIQGGDPEGTGRGGPGYKFADEFKDDLIFDAPGKLAMANAGSNTNGSQFFITHVPTPWLNGKHTIFGEVVEGQDVVNAIEQNDIIKTVTIVRNGEDAKSFSCTQKDFDTLVNKGIADVIETIKKQFPNAQKDENGIYYVINKKGTGSITGSNKTVTVDYKGYFLNGKVFDNSQVSGRQPLEFTTDAGRMIKGFDIMVQNMRVGENRTIIIPPQLGYGSQDYGPIPGNSYICFDIILLTN
ncbi:MAG: peptidylprolyl isomerase [Treponema sp. CETP13]|nr:MAG: peptidylprolyl isomerase [Treponema sp. CETP13]